MQIQLVLNLQSTYHKIENLQLILNMQHAGPYFHLGPSALLKWRPVLKIRDKCHTNQHYTFSLRSLNKLFQFINILLSSELSRYPEESNMFMNWNKLFSERSENV